MPNNFELQVKAAAQELLLCQVDATTKAIDESKASISLALTDAGTDDLHVGLAHYTDAKTGAPSMARILHGPAAADPGTGAGADDLYLGGGGAPMLVNVTGLQLEGDCILCQSLDGATNYLVAVAPDLRISLHAADAIPGIGAVTYDYTNGAGGANYTALNSVQSRIATLPDSTTETQYLTPAYIPMTARSPRAPAGASQIFIVPLATGLMVGDPATQVLWQEVSNGREWAWDPNS